MTTAESAAEPETSPQAPSLAELFLRFFLVSIIGFGGVFPFAYRLVVEQRRWMTQHDFAEVMAFSQFLPGGNIINFVVVLGQRYHGALGSIVCILALLIAPSAIVVLLGMLYLRFGQITVVNDALGGVTAAAAGLIFAIALKMAKPMFRREAAVPLAFAAAVFLAVAVGGVPLAVVVLAAAPLSVAFAWWKLR